MLNKKWVSFDEQKFKNNEIELNSVFTSFLEFGSKKQDSIKGGEKVNNGDKVNNRSSNS